jgi:hypothetical protein
LESEKKAGEKPEFEEFMKERIGAGFLNLKRGQWGIFVEVSKQVKGEWHNLRFDGEEILVLRDFMNDAVKKAVEVDDDPFGAKKLERRLASVKKVA